MGKRAAAKPARKEDANLRTGPPFDGLFFSTVFRERANAHCEERPREVPVVLLHLGGDCVLDLCHIQLLTPRWMAVAAFRDSASCDAMDSVFVPYEAIMRVTLTRRDAGQKRIGFQLDKSTLVVADARQGGLTHFP